MCLKLRILNPLFINFRIANSEERGTELKKSPTNHLVLAKTEQSDIKPEIQRITSRHI